MPRGSATDNFTALLQRLLARPGGRQIFVFGPEGEPFWSAYPVTTSDIDKLDAAIQLLESLEKTHTRPFFDFDHERNVLVAALDEAEDLYFVVLEALYPEAAVARAQLFRAALSQHGPWLRKEIERKAASH